MKETLLEISNDLQDLMDLLENLEGPEGDEETRQILRSAVEIRTADMEKKLEGYAYLVREYTLRAEAQRKEADRLLALSRSNAAKAERLQETILWAMQTHGLRRVETNRFRLTASRNGGLAPLQITVPAEQLPRDFVNVVLEPNKDAIRKAIDAGQNIPGVSLGERGVHLKIA